jgi:hypothetical protein
MHTNLYLSIEYQKPNDNWNFFFRFPDTGYIHELQTLLGIDTEDDTIPEDICLPLKGFPGDVDEKSIEEDAFTVDDEASESDIGDILDDFRFCTREQAEEWVEEQDSILIKNGYGVTDPETFGQSWASLSEVKNVLHLCEQHKVQGVHILRALVAAMDSLEKDGFNTRIVYWFS